jgi:phosphoribosylaminoimidazole (AIR) synthetase
MGIGLLLITKEKFVSKCMKIIKRNKLKAFKIGFIEKGEGNVLFRRNGAK